MRKCEMDDLIAVVDRHTTVDVREAMGHNVIAMIPRGSDSSNVTLTTQGMKSHN